MRELLAFGIPFVPSALATLVINLSDRFLVKYFLGLEMVGVYGIVYRLGLPMLLVVRAFRAAWAPALLSLPDAEEGRKLSARITTYFCLGGMLLFLGVSAYARELIHLISGRNAGIYLEGQAVVPIVTLGFVFYGIYVILTGAVVRGISDPDAPDHRGRRCGDERRPECASDPSNRARRRGLGDSGCERHDGRCAPSGHAEVLSGCLRAGTPVEDLRRRPGSVSRDLCFRSGVDGHRDRGPGPSCS